MAKHRTTSGTFSVPCRAVPCGDGVVFDVAQDLTPGAEGVLVTPRLLPVGRYERPLEVVAISADAGQGVR